MAKLAACSVTSDVVSVPSVVEELKVPVIAEVREKLSFIDEFDFSPIHQRLKNVDGWTETNISKIELEVKKFLSLALFEEGEYCMSEECDDYWHTMILHTKLYREFCEGLYGRFLDHTPWNGVEGDRELLRDTYNNTRKTLMKYFNFNIEFWPENSMVCLYT